MLGPDTWLQTPSLGTYSSGTSNVGVQVLVFRVRGLLARPVLLIGVRVMIVLMVILIVIEIVMAILTGIVTVTVIVTVVVIVTRIVNKRNNSTQQ